MKTYYKLKFKNKMETTWNSFVSKVYCEIPSLEDATVKKEKLEAEFKMCDFQLIKVTEEPL